MKWEIDWKRIMPSTLHPPPYTLRRAQTTVEYLLVTVALTVTFFAIYKILQVFLSRQFRMSGVIILKMYNTTWN